MINLSYKISYLHFRRKLVIFGIFCLCILFLPSLCEAGYDHNEYLKFCNSETFEKKYETGLSGCWSCAIVHWLMNAMVTAIIALSDPVLELSKLILNLGAAIWLAMFFLKSLGSFTVQDPAKIIDAVLTFMFKWALVFTLIHFGIDEIVGQIINPLLSIGMDIGTEFSNATGN